jgi:Xaa-Pro aminopeptidase
VDFDHGTGHGVGSYLGVHEGPQRISKTPSSVALQPGMIISNEPGYYKKSSYGIRLENLVVVQAVNLESADREMLGFETITFAPFDNTMIDTSLLTHLEIEWINSYHASVRQILGPLLPTEVASWLEKATMKIQ